jgi:hypothetical protein
MLKKRQELIKEDKELLKNNQKFKKCIIVVADKEINMLVPLNLIQVSL